MIEAVCRVCILENDFRQQPLGRERMALQIKVGLF